MNTRGFGWGMMQESVTCDNNQVLLSIWRSIPKLAIVSIEFERLQGIFDKDHANGRGTESVVDAMKNEIDENQVDDEDWLQHYNSPPSSGNTLSRGEHVSTGPPPKHQHIAQLTTRFIKSFNDKIDAVMIDFEKIADKMLDYSQVDPSKRDLVEKVNKLGLPEE